jgi:hypothetical protein
MNYRTTFDTTNIPANTKKNIKVLNEAALQRDKNTSDKAALKEKEGSDAGLTPKPKEKDGFGSESDSEGEDEESLMPKSVKDMTEKERKKAEW